MILAVGVDIEDQPSDWHNAVVQTTNGCCLDLESLIATVDRHVGKYERRKEVDGLVCGGP